MMRASLLAVACAGGVVACSGGGDSDPACAGDGDTVELAAVADTYIDGTTVHGDEGLVQIGATSRGLFSFSLGPNLEANTLKFTLVLTVPGTAEECAPGCGACPAAVAAAGNTISLVRSDWIESEVTSDTAPLNGLVERLLDAAPGVRGLRDATRGGVATICNEVARAAGVAVVLEEEAVPVRPDVRGACELLGIDPLYVACEGRLVAVVDGDQVEAAMAALRSHPLGEGAAVIGRVRDDPPGLVLLKTSFGGTRIVDLLVGDPLPRIC